MFRISRASAEKRADVDIARPTAGWGIRLVPDKHVPGDGIAAEEPPIAVGAAIKLPRLDCHPSLLMLAAQHRGTFGLPDQCLRSSAASALSLADARPVI